MARIALVALALGVLASACGSDEAEQLRSLPACEHFQDVADDVRAGLLTAPELREKLQEIDNDARVAPDDIQIATEAMLRAITQADGPGLVSAGTQMEAACTANENGAS